MGKGCIVKFNSWIYFVLKCKIIRLNIVIPNIGLSLKWSAAKVYATGYNIVINRKLFTIVGLNFNCNSFNRFVSDPDIQELIEHPMIDFLILAFY